MDKSDEESCKKLFLVKDFIGDACKKISSRIRGAVSTVTFDNFHKKSSDIIKNAVHCKDEHGNYMPFEIKENGL